MARFFLHLKAEDKLIPDEDGAEFPDLTAAQREALASLRSILADALISEREPAIVAIAVADETGQEVLEVALPDVLPAKVKKLLTPESSPAQGSSY
jgi:plasmid stability protein